MKAQHIDRMTWTNAPEWATHIVGWIGEPQTCFWAQEIDGCYFGESQRIEQHFSFSLTTDDDEDDTFGWVIVSTRPNAEVSGAGTASAGLPG